MVKFDPAPVAIAFTALVMYEYSSASHTPFGVRVIPLPLTALFAPIPNEMLLLEVFTNTRLFLFAFAAITWADDVPTVAKVGVRPVSAVLVLTGWTEPLFEPMPGFWDTLA